MTFKTLMHSLGNMRWIFQLSIVFAMHHSCLGTYSLSYSETLRYGKVYNYIYFPQQHTWNEARSVCQSIGGDLAKIDSDEIKKNIVDLLKSYYGDGIFTIDYWVGLVNMQLGAEYLWVADCSNLTITDDPATWDNWDGSKTEYCFLLKKKDHVLDRKSCDDDKKAFMCQVLTDEPCRVIPFITSTLLYGSQGMDTCKERCNNNTACWAAIGFYPDNCVQLAVSGNGDEEFFLSTKLCLNVTVNTTAVNPPANKSKIPDVTCGSFTNLTVSNVSIAGTTNGTNLTITPTPCEPVNVTVYTNFTTTVYFTATLNLTTEQASEIAEEYVKNLTVDAKSTSAHTRTLTSAVDKRTSSRVVGLIGVIFIVTPFALMCISDIRRIVVDLGLIQGN